MALKRHHRVFLEVKGRSLMYSSGDSAKDKCASVRKGNVSKDACTTPSLSQRERPPPAHSTLKTVPFTTIGYIFLAGGTVK